MTNPNPDLSIKRIRLRKTSVTDTRMGTFCVPINPNRSVSQSHRQRLDRQQREGQNMHYRQVLEAHFEKTLQITCSDTQKTPETTSKQKTDVLDFKQKTPEIQAQTIISGVKGMSDTGFEPVTSTV